MNLEEFAMDTQLLQESETLHDLECADMEYIGPIGPRDVKSGDIIENKIIVTMPGQDTAVEFANKKDVTLRNVIIYHPANARGIRTFRTHNLRLENVEVIAYGNEWGAQPCPTRAPFKGYGCINILVYNSEGLSMQNVRAENGSKGIAVVKSPGAVLDTVVVKNPRGPYPAGQCVQFSQSHYGSLTNFHCLSELDVAYNEDSISLWRSSHVTLKDGVIDGNNATTGQCVQVEGSKKGVTGGLIENVEAINCQGCFAGSPIVGLREKNLMCASTICKSDNPPRGGKNRANMWTAGVNRGYGLKSDDI